MCSAILIISSTKDPASANIAQQILEHYDFEELSEAFHESPIYLKKLRNVEVRLLSVQDKLINAQYITDYFDPQLIVFVSRHSSLRRIPTLSVHTPGNLVEAVFGGVPRKVSISPASAMKNALLEMTKLREEMGLDYQVSYECTHHGPSLDVPAMFVELGSSLKQWKDLRAAEAVAHAAMAAVSERSTYPAVLGLGGPHYNAKFTKIALTTQIAFGQMIPKHAIPQLDGEMIRLCVERTVERVKSAILDWKGIRGADKGKLITILDEIGVSIEKIR